MASIGLIQTYNMKASESLYSKIDWLPTGFRELDRILGGGIPSRRITEISGPTHVGKSTLVQHIVANAQKAGMACLWADTEFQYTLPYSASFGIDNDSLELIQTRLAEDVLDQIEEWADKNKDGLIVLDSIGGLLTRAEAEKSADGKVIGGQAKIIATFCRKIVPILAINNIALVVLNHQFTDLMSGRLKTSGGAKLEYAKSIWLSLRKANKRVMQGDQQVGDIVEAEVRKNKLDSTTKQKCELTLLYGTGFSAEADLLAELLASGEVTKKGNSYFRGETKLGVGLAKAREALKI